MGTFIAAAVQLGKSVSCLFRNKTGSNVRSIDSAAAVSKKEIL